MQNKKTLLFLTIAIMTMSFVSCNKNTPEIIQDPGCRFFAACFGHDQWVSQKLYTEVVTISDVKNLSENYTKKDLRNLEVLVDEEVSYDEKVTSDELYDFFVKGKIPVSNEDISEPSEQDVFDIFFEAIFQDKKARSKSRALEIAYEVCGREYLKAIKGDICNHVKVYEYSKDKKVSTKNVSVYNVVYIISNIREYNDKYVRCTIEDRGLDGSSIKYVKSSTMYSDLYSSEVDL